uniref:Uncharacterized protein n=1 Tax=Tetranychus urticae TaxID=32264 RepID=T1KI78_TETUR
MFASIYTDESAPSVLPEFYDLINTKGQITNLTIHSKNSIGSMIVRTNTLVELARRFCNKGIHSCILQNTKPDDPM